MERHYETICIIKSDIGEAAIQEIVKKATASLEGGAPRSVRWMNGAGEGSRTRLRRSTKVFMSCLTIGAPLK